MLLLVLLIDDVDELFLFLVLVLVLFLVLVLTEFKQC